MTNEKLQSILLHFPKTAKICLECDHGQQSMDARGIFITDQKDVSEPDNIEFRYVSEQEFEKGYTAFEIDWKVVETINFEDVTGILISD